MKIEAVEDYEELSARAASLFIGQAKKRPDSVCVLPTGRTPEGLFRLLVDAHHRNGVNFSRLRFVTLDEYAGIRRDDRRCLYQWLRRALFDPIGISMDQVAAFNPASVEPDAEAARIEMAIAAWGGIDLAIVGLGPNGHVGFNEPGSTADSRARQVALTEESIVSNARYWGSKQDVPRSAYTLGIATLREARSIILMASGIAKAAILARALEGPESPDIPASLLRSHVGFTVLADREALSARAHST
jgi:glucosamine-6-phosphate deaminase